MHRNVVTVEMNEPVSTALSLMASNKTKYLIVLVNSKLLGVVSKSDLRNQRGDEFQKERTLMDVLKLQDVSARPRDSLGRGLVLMKRWGLSCLPIVEDRELKGFVALSELVARINYRLPSKPLARRSQNPAQL